jgi:N-alpha-acetyltransferase 15/16, NatA auxiliary subunit
LPFFFEHYGLTLHPEKYVLALCSLNAALALDSTHPRVHEQAVALQHALNSCFDSLPAKVAEVLKSEFKVVSKSTDLANFNLEFAKKNASSPSHILSAISVRKLLGEDRSKCDKDIVSILNMDNITMEVALKAFEILKSTRSGELEAFKKASKEKWADASIFS